MKAGVQEASQWVYRGVWAVLVHWFRVPDQPPSLPTEAGETAQSFRPAEGFLKHMKFRFWVLLAVIDAALLAVWFSLGVASPVAGLVTAPLWLAVIVVPDIAAYVAIHLRYDTTWYVLTGRSLRLRRGVWIIHETTITFENVQNVVVRQGPLERYFGIANVLVETAGGGSSQGQKGESAAGMAHQGLIEGVANAAEIRDLILARLRRTRSAGLGDDAPAPAARVGLSAEHLELVREIRDAARQLAEAAAR